MSKKRNPRQFADCGVSALYILVCILAVVFWRKQEKTTSAVARPSEAVASASGDQMAAVPALNASSNVTATVPPPSPASAVLPSPASTADGKDLASIRQWAHNELEVQRMIEENDRIYRRQLVVINDTVAAIIERNRLTGERIQQLTLQGLDGQEIAFEIKQADIEPSGLRGMFHGRVAGRPDSMVTLAFLQNRQAYTILSPADNLYLDVEPHEPGEVIVKSINLEKYGTGLCGTP